MAIMVSGQARQMLCPFQCCGVSLAATGRLNGSSEKFHWVVKGKDFCLSFLPKDGILG